jgi:hypothetical protein
MRHWWIPALVLLAACSDDDDVNGPGVTPETPSSLSSTSLDEAIALVWSDNPFQADPDIFGNYRVYSTTYDIDNDECGSDWAVEGTTVAPEFLVGALANGVPRCFSVTAVSVDGLESDRSPVRGDTPRPDSRNVVLAAAPQRRPAPASGSGTTSTETAPPRPRSWAWSAAPPRPTSTSSWTATGTATSS